MATIWAQYLTVICELFYLISYSVSWLEMETKVIRFERQSYVSLITIIIVVGSTNCIVFDRVSISKPFDTKRHVFPRWKVELADHSYHGRVVMIRDRWQWNESIRKINDFRYCKNKKIKPAVE